MDLEKSNFLNSYNQNLPLGHVRLRKKIVTNRFSRFEVYRLQTNRQTKLYIYIDAFKVILKKFKFHTVKVKKPV